MQYSLQPGMSGYLGLPPVAMMKYFDVISVSFPRLFTVYNKCKYLTYNTSIPYLVLVPHAQYN